MAQSHIEWTQMTWNPTTGCDKISTGCKFCYAEIMARRLKAMGLPKYKKGFRLSLHEDVVDLPYSWKRPKLVFVNSMSDLFHKDIPIEFIQRVFKVMNDCRHHTFQVLTKRADVLLHYNSRVTWTHNIWMGVSVESEQATYRIPYLRRTGAHVKFLSLEPLIGALPDLDLEGIDWVIVGGESGPGARPVKKEWVLDIRHQCRKAGVAFFFKQWGGIRKNRRGRSLNGRTYDEMPKALPLMVLDIDVPP